MRSRVTFCTVFASVLVDFKSTGTESNRNFNDLVSELSIRFDLIPKVKTEPIGSVRNRIIARRITTSRNENDHAILKHRLESFSDDLKMMINNINFLLMNKYQNYLLKLKEEKNRYSLNSRKKIY
jgi:restriction endonuclease Mrr